MQLHLSSNRLEKTPVISAVHISGAALTVFFTIEELTTSAGSLRPNGKGIKKKPISATISSQEKPALLKIEGRPKMMRERDWMIYLKIKERIAGFSVKMIICFR